MTTDRPEKCEMIEELLAGWIEEIPGVNYTDDPTRLVIPAADIVGFLRKFAADAHRHLARHVMERAMGLRCSVPVNDDSEDAVTLDDLRRILSEAIGEDV